jgi:hypothetical protein
MQRETVTAMNVVYALKRQELYTVLEVKFISKMAFFKVLESFLIILSNDLINHFFKKQTFHSKVDKIFQ